MNKPSDPICEIMELSHGAAEILDALAVEPAKIHCHAIASVFAVVFRRIRECADVLDNDG